MPKREPIRVFEHRQIVVDQTEGFTSKHFKLLEKYGYQTREKYFSVGNKRIKFKSYVGVIQAADLVIEILPKADNSSNTIKWHKALINILSELKKIKIDSVGKAKLDTQRSSLIDVLFDQFLSEVELLVRSGFRKTYNRFESNLKSVKGRILHSENIRRNLVHKERFFTNHSIYNKNTLLNQTINTALLVLKNLTQDQRLLLRSDTLLVHFENVDTINPSKLSLLDRVPKNRNYSLYQESIVLAKLIIRGHFPNLQSGDSNVISLLFNMDKLFEDFITHRMKKSLGSGYEIIPQNKIPFWRNKGLKADILVKCPDDSKVVIDTKWKVDNKFPSDPDLKQMFAYNTNYDANRAVLLYPNTNNQLAVSGVYNHENFNELECEVSFLNVVEEDGSISSEIETDLRNLVGIKRK